AAPVAAGGGVASADRAAGGAEVGGDQGGRGRGAVGHGGEVAAGVGGRDGQHQGHVLGGGVVPVHRRALPRRGGQGLGAGAQVHRGRGGGVVDVLGVLDAVLVGVHPGHRPGGGDELHRPDRAVIDRVVVVLPAVGVQDPGGAAGAVQRDPVDPGFGLALR